MPLFKCHSGLTPVSLTPIFVGSIQVRQVTMGQNIVTETFAYDTLYDNSDPDDWVEYPGVRRNPELVKSVIKREWRNMNNEYRTCSSLQLRVLRLMFRVLSFSLVMSLISLMIVLIVPVTLTEYGPRVGPSPYRQEIDALYLKTSKGLRPNAPEWDKITELVQKNNDWFDVAYSRQPVSKLLSPLAVWKLKGSKLAPGLMLLWGVCFYFLIRTRVDVNTLSVLIIPALLTVAQLLSLLSMLLISTAVCGVSFCLYVVKKL